MATAKRLTENHLTCAICTEVFTDPVTLQCNHTFCKSCLLKYTKTQSEAIEAKSIPCPSCRQQTKVTNPDSPVEEWVSQLKPSHVIQSLMDDFGSGTEAAETGECSGHEVSESTFFPMTTKRSFMCKHHASKQIELFCKDCKMAICTICCSINHRTCDDVDTIENMTPHVTEQLTKRNQELNLRIGNIKHGISLKKKHSDNFRNKIEEAKDQIRNMRAKVVKLIMKKEKQLLHDVDQSCTEYLHQIQTDIESSEIELQMYQQQYEFAVNALTSSCEMDMYAIYESVCETSLESRITDNRPAPGRVVFTHNMDKLSKAVDKLNLGEVKIVQDVLDRESIPTLYQTIDCMEGHDMAYPALHDLVVLAVDGVKEVVVVVDCNSKRLNIYYTSAIHCPKYIQLSDTPCRLMKLTNWQVAVSVPGSNEIVTVKVYPHPVILSTIKTNRPYFGLACLSPSRLVAGATGGTDMLDMEGNVLKSFKTGKVSIPSYIHVTGNRNLIVSNGVFDSLVSVTSEGDAVFTYTPTGDRSLKFPQGITTTSTGDILLADKDSHKVIQLTESGQFVRDVLTAQDGIVHPCGICLDTDGFLYVTCGNAVKVFRFD